MDTTITSGTTWKSLDQGVHINEAAWTPLARRFFTPEVVSLIALLHRELEPVRQHLLEARRERQMAWDAGAVPTFLPEDELPGAYGDWKVAPIPPDLRVRRVEITGPINRPNMVINMLSRNHEGVRADCAMLDFEDSMKPAWQNVMQGVENLIGAVDGTLTYVKLDEEGRPIKEYRLDPTDMPVIMVRCRGLHLYESNLLVDEQPVAAGLLDLTLSVYYTARKLVAQGKTPKYYVPKVEHYLEARWWNTLFRLLEEAVELPIGTLRTTFLIETLPAAFQMEEILYELRERATALNVGRWDKIFSDIKVLKEHADCILADRGTISLNRPWMQNYALLLIKTCHRHGAYAMGGMAAFTPGKTPEEREEQTRKVIEDKQLEFSMGHDGCWVSHPYFIGPALSAFPRENQLDVIPDIPDHPDLLPKGTPPHTLAGLRKNVRVGIAYMKGWVQDIGCIAWDNLMEDLATLEISRAQTWQWLHHRIMLDDGVQVTPQLVREIFQDEHERIKAEVTEALHHNPALLEKELRDFARGREAAETLFTERILRPFLTCYSELVGQPADLSSSQNLKNCA